MGDWFNLLKTPVSIDAQPLRDTDFIKTIIEYEKSLITPYFEKYFQEQSAGSSSTIFISFKDMDVDSQNGAWWWIGIKNKGLMGNNNKFILDEIKEVYEQEGWATNLSGDTLEIKMPE